MLKGLPVGVVLGAILVHNDAFNLAAPVVDAGDFFRDAHRRIFERMVALNERRQAVDFVTLKEELQRAGDLDRRDGLPQHGPGQQQCEHRLREPELQLLARLTRHPTNGKTATPFSFVAVCGVNMPRTLQSL